MARRSILAPVLTQEEPEAPTPSVSAPEAAPAPSAIKPSRLRKLHLGGYFDPDDPAIIAFQKLRFDLRKSQQDMLMEAIRDFLAKHEALNAFR